VAGGDRGAADEHESPRSQLRQLARHQQTESAEAPGDQVGRVRAAGADGHIRRGLRITDQARRVAHAQPVSELVLAVGLGHVREKGGDGFLDRRAGIEIDEAAPELGVLGREGPPEAPEWRRRHRAHVTLRARRLRPAGHEPEPRRRAAGPGQRLGEPEHACGPDAPGHRQAVGGGVGAGRSVEAPQVDHPRGAVRVGEPGVHDSGQVGGVRPGVDDERIVARGLEAVREGVAHALAVGQDEASQTGRGLRRRRETRRGAPLHRAQPVVATTGRRRPGPIVEIPQARTGQLRDDTHLVHQSHVTRQDVGRTVWGRPPHRVREQWARHRPAVERDPVDPAPDEGPALLAV